MRVGVPPVNEGPGTSIAPLAAFSNAAHVGKELATIAAGDAGGRPNVVGACAALFLADAIGGPLAVAVVTLRRGWSLNPNEVVLRYVPGGWFDLIRIGDCGLHILDTDRDLRTAPCIPHVEVASLRRAVAENLVEVFAPIFATLAAHTPYGVRHMWGHLLDQVHAHALRAAQPRMTSQQAAAEAEALTATVADLLAAGVSRPRRLVAPGRSQPPIIAVKGSCCLMFRTRPTAALEDATCRSCPLITDEVRLSRLVSLH